ncbi:MAG: hypothetical protein JWO95_292, partial [Verrucomicrobiales bacterium]|nr:hypothetical protein [Verrucomicrobiales bacterium]
MTVELTCQPLDVRAWIINLLRSADSLVRATLDCNDGARINFKLLNLSSSVSLCLCGKLPIRSCVT